MSVITISGDRCAYLQGIEILRNELLIQLELLVTSDADLDLLVRTIYILHLFPNNTANKILTQFGIRLNEQAYMHCPEVIKILI